MHRLKAFHLNWKEVDETMAFNILSIILFAVIVTACISGIFGMAGGLIFMGVLASLMGVAEAMVVHGFVQSIANSSRAFLLKDDIRWDIFLKIVLGSLPAIGLLALVSFIPSKGVLFCVLGLLPLLLWLPKRLIHLDAQIPAHAVFCGFCSTGLNLVAGAAGPALDMFFVRTNLSRQEVVATKAVTMVCSHMMKIFYFGIPLLKLHGLSSLPPLWFFIAVIPLAMIGTFTGTRILKRLSDIGFRKYTRLLVTIIGVIYIWRGLVFLGWL